MLDCHCHILPAVDDGAADLQQSIAMLQRAKQLDITQIVATPHMKRQPFNWTAIEEAYARLKPEAEQLEIQLQLGCELYAPLLSELGFDEIQQFCIRGTNRLLLEFHPHYLPDNLPAYFNNIFCRNIVPILAHPERYSIVQSDPTILQEIVQMGCYLQINGRSMTANPFDKCSNTAKKLLKLYPSAFLSSDAHCIEHYAGLTKAQQKLNRMRRDLP